MSKAKYRIKGNDKIPGYDSEIEIEVDNKYEAYSKKIPEPTPYQGFTITWFNSFGVRSKATGKNARATYSVKLKKLPAGKRLFAFYRDEVHELATEDAGSGNIKFTLNVGDPPIGTGP
ncbi:MAG TPA: hypothetical protein VLT51_09175 [Anaerolineales bacterium]|nr:hypothetical protein [Anaerolineales bacterium]